MKLINDLEYFENQITWFDKQIKNFDIVNFKVSGISDKDKKVRDILNGSSVVLNTHLEALRSLLSDKGLKKLSNSLASAKKRKNSNKKSLQLMLSLKTILKLEKLAKSKSMTISEYLEDL